MTNCKFEANKLVSIDITHAEINTNSLKKQIFKMYNLLNANLKIAYTQRNKNKYWG